jgi:hypothetical protein
MMEHTVWAVSATDDETSSLSCVNESKLQSFQSKQRSYQLHLTRLRGPSRASRGPWWTHWHARSAHQRTASLQHPTGNQHIHILSLLWDDQKSPLRCKCSAALKSEGGRYLWEQGRAVEVAVDVLDQVQALAPDLVVVLQGRHLPGNRCCLAKVFTKKMLKLKMVDRYNCRPNIPCPVGKPSPCTKLVCPADQWPPAPSCPANPEDGNQRK